jgi:hypothetical protein
MMLDNTIKSTFKDAAKKLTGYRKREFTAKVTEDYFAGSARQAETGLGWCRHSINKAIKKDSRNKCYFRECIQSK